MSGSILPRGLPAPAPSPDGLDAPYWEAARRHELVAQRCRSCRTWQWGPDWICHHCLSFELVFEPVPGGGRIFAWERVWHPVHPALKTGLPYVPLVVELPGAGGIRMLGDLAGDPTAPVEIGALVEPVFEDHPDGDPPYTLIQWHRKR
ncbi:MAG: zinc ribbon domain-containing protein [Myxococcota bacterium]